MIILANKKFTYVIAWVKHKVLDNYALRGKMSKFHNQSTTVKDYKDLFSCTKEKYAVADVSIVFFPLCMYLILYYFNIRVQIKAW